MYFIPFLGICLVLFRCFVYNKGRYIATALIISGIILLIPKIVGSLLKLFKQEIMIPHLAEILESDIYIKLIGYSKTLIIVGVILLITTYIFNIIAAKLGNSLGNYLKEEQKREQEISEKNDLIMKEKQVKAQNTHFVRCPNCGANNTVIGNIGKCKYCRCDITYKEKISK